MDILQILKHCGRSRYPRLAGCAQAGEGLKYQRSAHLRRYRERAMGTEEGNTLGTPAFSRQGDLLILLLIAVVLLTLAFTDSSQSRGDSREYFQMLFSFANHGSPDLRPGDLDSYREAGLRGNIDNPYSSNGYNTTSSGSSYSVHFWLYPLVSLPALWFLRIFGQDDLIVFQVTNALLLLFAVACLLLFSGFKRNQRWLFTALVLISPAMWYMDWPGPEIFSFSLVIASIACFSRNKLALAVLAAALASTQNAPIIVLVLFYLAHGVYGIIKESNTRKRLTTATLLGVSALPALVPMIFSYIEFGTPNMLYRTGAASFSGISLQRTQSFFLDLNQGMLPYIPIILLVFVYLAVRDWRKREWLLYEISLVVLFMVLLSETTTNWNSDSEGIMRYGVWMIPLLIWGVAARTDLSLKTDKILLAVALCIQIVIVFDYPSWVIAGQLDSQNRPIYLYAKHNTLATYMLDNHPSLYNPEPEIFADRTLHADTHYWALLPVVYRRGDGKVTKILTDYENLDTLVKNNAVDPGIIQEQKESHRGDSGLFYINL